MLFYKKSYQNTPMFSILSCGYTSESVSGFPYYLSWVETEDRIKLNIFLTASQVVGATLELELPQELIELFDRIELVESWCFEGDTEIVSSIETGLRQIAMEVTRTDCDGQTGEGLFLSLLFFPHELPFELPTEANRLSGVIIMIDDVS